MSNREWHEDQGIGERTQLNWANEVSELRAEVERLTAELATAWTLKRLAQCVSAPEASVSARLRDLRKERFGAWRVERRRVPNGNGLHEYRVLPKLIDEQEWW